MRVLLVHNRYKNQGGESLVAKAEMDLIESHGHAVDLLEADNAEIAGFAEKLKAALAAPYSAKTKRRMAAQIATSRPDVVHVHNFFPLLSPSIYYACSEAGVPVVQTLHNYRLICPSSLLFRSGLPCEDCVGKTFAWPGVLHACYRDSRLGTASVAAMASTHHWLGTWHSRIDCFIALTDFSRRKLIEGGLPADKIVVKPNFALDPGGLNHGKGRFALFAGRLSSEKGIATLLSAWDHSNGPPLRLKVAGDGPLREDVVRSATAGHIEYLGVLSRKSVQALMCKAAFLVFPSICYENFPLSIVDAFASGLPVVASRLGAMAEIVQDGRTGLHFTPGDARDLAAKVEWARTHPKEMEEMSCAARAEYEERYTAERNYQQLTEAYGRVIAGRGAPRNFATGLKKA
ncbi:MAG: glycosyltransferase [Candidatus Acidiferrales bacterium]